MLSWQEGPTYSQPVSKGSLSPPSWSVTDLLYGPGKSPASLQPVFPYDK